MNKKTLIIIITLFILVGGIALFLFMGKLNSLQGIAGVQSGQSLGMANSVETSSSQAQDYGLAPGGDSLSIQTSQGVVSVNNFYNGKTIESNVPAVIISTNTGTDMNKDPYTIIYSRTDSSFEIYLGSEAVSSTRATAENDLVSILGVSKTDACKLNVSVWVNSDSVFADTDFNHAEPGGLTFCTATGGVFKGQ